MLRHYWINNSGCNLQFHKDLTDADFRKNQLSCTFNKLCATPPCMLQRPINGRCKIPLGTRDERCRMNYRSGRILRYQQRQEYNYVRPPWIAGPRLRGNLIRKSNSNSYNNRRQDKLYYSMTGCPDEDSAQRTVCESNPIAISRQCLVAIRYLKVIGDSLRLTNNRPIL
jgi:hypothetical protein